MELFALKLLSLGVISLTEVSPYQTQRVSETGVSAVPLFFSRRNQSSLPLAGREEQIAFNSVLLRVQVVVATTQSIELFVRSAFDDSSLLDDENLVGTSDRRKTVCNHERGTA